MIRDKAKFMASLKGDTGERIVERVRTRIGRVDLIAVPGDGIRYDATLTLADDRTHTGCAKSMRGALMVALRGWAKT